MKNALRDLSLAALLTSLLALPAWTQSAARKVDTSAFDLQKQPILKAFRRSSNYEDRRPSSLEEGAAAVREDHYFHGPTELQYLILYFATPEELTKWYTGGMKSATAVGFRLGPGKSGGITPMAVDGGPVSNDSVAWRREGILEDSQRAHLSLDKRTLELWARLDLRTWRSEVVSGQTVLLVQVSPHYEEIRRSHAKAGDFLTNKQMVEVVEKVIKELARRAKSFKPTL